MNTDKMETCRQHGINPHKIPHHVAVIMDGNGRWAQRRGKPRVYGHQKGVDSVREIVDCAAKLGVKVLTLFAFSEENWGRPKEEVEALLALLNAYIQSECQNLKDNGISFKTIGDLDKLPEKSRNLILKTEAELAQGQEMKLVIAISYGGRTEIVNCAKKIAEKVMGGELRVEDINQSTFSSLLWTSDISDPDLLIRTSGEQRLSNFLLWQVSYSELLFSPVDWPDFTRSEFYKSICEFQNRRRRFGKLEESETNTAILPQSQDESSINA